MTYPLQLTVQWWEDSDTARVRKLILTAVNEMDEIRLTDLKDVLTNDQGTICIRNDTKETKTTWELPNVDHD